MQPKKKITYKAAPLWIMAAVAGVLLCAGTVYYWYATSNSNALKIRRLNSSIATTRTAVSGLIGDYSDQKAEQSRADADKVKNSMMTGAEADAFITGLRPIWSVVSRSESANDEFVKRRYQIARGSAPVSVWPETLALFTRMSEIDSLSVDNVDIQTVGDNRKREFGRIGLTLIIYIKKPQ